MTAPIVFFDIAGPEDSSLEDFYFKVFGWAKGLSEAGAASSVTVPVVSPGSGSPTLKGAFRRDPAEKMLYIGVDDVTASLQEIVEHGGNVDRARFEVPGVVVLGLFSDPAGNRMGLVEMDNGKARVPSGPS